MHKPPHTGEKGVKRGEPGPIRTAGITPGPSQNPAGDEPMPEPAE
jgi:cytochrome d ubiquinol oxidase subunit I